QLRFFFQAEEGIRYGHVTGVQTCALPISCHSTLQIDADRDIWRRCSSSSQSLTVDPDSTVPSRFVAPAWNRSASTRDVFPVPRCPTTATLRIFPGSSGNSLAPLVRRLERRIVSRG